MYDLFLTTKITNDRCNSFITFKYKVSCNKLESVLCFFKKIITEMKVIQSHLRNKTINQSLQSLLDKHKFWIIIIGKFSSVYKSRMECKEIVCLLHWLNKRSSQKTDCGYIIAIVGI